MEYIIGGVHKLVELAARMESARLKSTSTAMYKSEHWRDALAECFGLLGR
jgi:hypothetical protein